YKSILVYVKFIYNDKVLHMLVIRCTAKYNSKCNALFFRNSSNQNHLNILSIPTPSTPNISSSVEPAVLAFSSTVADAANTASNTARDIATVA
ncbi:11474_t:CDS:2, partial [Racocetra persica]